MRKHGGAKRRVWRKVHLAIDEATMEVRAVEITESSIGDAPMLPGLLSQIPAGEPVASVTADGAYDGRTCRDAIASRGAEAIIPPAGTQSPGRRTAQGRGRGTKPCAPSSASVGRSGADGAATTAEAASRRR